ncbi:MAG: DUF4271 domain-containing protein [Saprospiraceae bacterium]
MGKKVCLISMLFLMGWTLVAQTGNPFDLTPRLGQQPDTSIQTIQNTGNPFDIQPGVQENKPVEKREPSAPVFKKPKEIISTPEGKSTNSPFLFTLIVSMLVLAAIFMTLLREFIGKIYTAFLNDNLLNQLHREQGPVAMLPYQLLYLLAFINEGIFLYLLLKYFGQLPYEGSWANLFACIGLIAGIFLGKHLLLSFLAWLFPIEKELKVYSFTIMVFNIMVGLLLIIFNVILAYAPDEIISIAIYIALGMLALVYLFRQLRSLFAASRFVAFHKLHFLLYLCAVEIAPVLVLIKMIMLASGANEH